MIDMLLTPSVAIPGAAALILLVLAVLVWATRDLVLAGKLSGDAWAVLMTVAGGVMGVAAAASTPVVRDVLKSLVRGDES